METTFTPATTTPQPAKTTQFATFGAGCFWGVEAFFREIPGVVDVTVGYSGGRTENPNYRQVCSHTTGHAEVARVEYDPSVVSYDQLLAAFWENHDPTQLNRQGPDFGDQYRSVIFFFTPEQEMAAQASKAALDGAQRFKRPVVTQIVPAETFYPAEDYHQRYFEKHGLAICHI